MPKPRTGKRPPQGTVQVSQGRVVGQLAHGRALFAHQKLHEINDPDIWSYRETFNRYEDVEADRLRTVLKARYGEFGWPIIQALLKWLG